MVGWMRGRMNGYLSGWVDEQMNEWGLYLKADFRLSMKSQEL